MPGIPQPLAMWQRVFFVAGAIALVGYGAFGLWVGDLLAPARQGGGIHLHGTPAIVMFLAFVAFAAGMLCDTAARADRRDPSRRHASLARIGYVTGFALAVLSLVLHYTH